MTMSDVTGSLPTREELLRLVGLQAERSASESMLTILGTFAAGAMIGAGLALLFAPKSGEALRSDLSRRTSALRDEVLGERREQSEPH
jgi:YtxH-like protein